MADTTASGDSAFLQALKKSKAHHLRVHLSDGAERDIDIPGGKRKNWAKVVEVLDKLAWLRVEARSVKGNILDIFDNEELEEEDFEDNKLGTQTRQMLALMLKAQDVALKRNSEMMRQSNDMNLQLCRVLMDRLVALEKGFMANLKIAQKFAATAAGADEDDLMSSPLVEMLMPVMMQKMMPGLLPAPAAAPAAAPAGEPKTEGKV